MNQEELSEKINAVIDPYSGETLSTADAVKSIEIEGEHIVVNLTIGYPLADPAQLLSEIKSAIGNEQVKLNLRSEIKAHTVQQQLKPLKGIKNIIAVASGKGGVGKSTTAVNLALALKAEGANVGLLDADIYGPSQPQMLGISDRKPESEDGKTMLPLESHGLKAMSIGFLVEQDSPMVWRGPMVTQALMQLLNETKWGELDYLIVDLPPGTGDTQLTLSQKIPVAGAVIITTPQDIALLDAKKGLRMFEKVKVPVLGVIENMSTHICTNCGHVEPIFGEGGGEAMASKYNVPLLGQLPLKMDIRLQADGGKPTVAADPNSSTSALYRDIARKMSARLALKSRDFGHKFPNIVVQNT